MMSVVKIKASTFEIILLIYTQIKTYGFGVDKSRICEAKFPVYFSKERERETLWWWLLSTLFIYLFNFIFL